MVCLFFVISGIVLTQRALMFLRKGDLLGAYGTLTSSVFRRALRLFPSPLVSSLIALLLFRVFYVQPYGSNTETVPYKSNIFAQLWHWSVDTVRYLNIFDANLKSAFHENKFTGHAYANIIWTIPMEYAGSIACYVQLLGTAKLQPRIRNFVLLGLAFWGITTQRWALCAFNVGIVLGDVMLQEAQQPPILLSAQAKLGYTLLFLFGLYFAGMPMRGPVESYTPAFGFTTIWKLTPERILNYNFNFTWWVIAAIAILWSCYRLRPLRDFLESGFCQYLGKLSFAIYLTHIIVRDCIGEPLKTTLTRFFGADGYSSAWPQTVPCIIWYTVLLTVTFIASGLFEKHIDVRFIRLAKQIEDKVTALGRPREEMPLHAIPTASV
jgi:peptidoglycan/LPS O-acetylase OafA/YrhL